jgi:hypothetical protein
MASLRPVGSSAARHRQAQAAMSAKRLRSEPTIRPRQGPRAEHFASQTSPLSPSVSRETGLRETPRCVSRPVAALPNGRSLGARRTGLEDLLQRGRKTVAFAGQSGCGSHSSPPTNPASEDQFNAPVRSFHVKPHRWITAHPPVYPQGVQAFYVAFHVKLASLWITPVDNFGVVGPFPSIGRTGRRGPCLNG